MAEKKSTADDRARKREEFLAKRAGAGEQRREQTAQDLSVPAPSEACECGSTEFVLLGLSVSVNGPQGVAQWACTQCTRACEVR